MKEISLSLFILFMFAGYCNSQEVRFNEKTEIIESSEQLDKYVGKSITIKGVVTDTKIPTIMGIDIVSDDPNLRGKLGVATGILQKTVFTEDEIDKYAANRGAGKFYKLKDPETNFAAQVQNPD